MQKNPHYEMGKGQILSGIGEDPDKNPDKRKIFIKNNVRNHSYHQIFPVLAKIRINRIRINRGLLYKHVPCARRLTSQDIRKACECVFGPVKSTVRMQNEYTLMSQNLHRDAWL